MRSVLSFSLLLLSLQFASPPLMAQDQQPNVVLIITDDMGYGDLGSYGSLDIRTANIDRIGREGVRLTNFYANGVLCTPTRAALITGKYQQRVGLEAALSAAEVAAEQGLPATGWSLPQLLADNGYTTALVGKWHLGYRPDMSPNAHGFDYFFGLKSGYIDYYTHTDGTGRPDLFENETPVQVEGYMTDLVTQRAVAFIEGNRDRPFFIDVAYNAPHWPYQVPDAPSRAPRNAAHLMPFEQPTSTRGDYVQMVERVDQGVGEILRTLDRLGLTENTLVVFTNDNGGEWLSDNGPLFGRKWTVWEGGIRVPALVRWPGVIPAGRVTGQVGITMDLTTTILAATRSAVPSEARLEGIDLLPILTGESPEIERTVYWRTPAGNRTQQAMRDGAWKLVVDANHTLLFDLSADPEERRDLARFRQDVVAAMMPRLRAWGQDVSNEWTLRTRGRYPVALPQETRFEERIDDATVVAFAASPPMPLEWRFDRPVVEWVDPWSATGPSVTVTARDGALGVRVGENPSNPSQIPMAGLQTLLPSWTSGDWRGLTVRLRADASVERLNASMQSWGLVSPNIPLGSGVGERDYLIPFDRIPDGQIGLPFGILFGTNGSPGNVEILSLKLEPYESHGVHTVRGRTALYLRSPGHLAYRVQIPVDGQLHFGMGVQRPDIPVRFRVQVAENGADPQTVFDETHAGAVLGPASPQDSSAWAQRSVNLTDFAGRTVTLLLVADAEAANVLAFWAEPTLTGRVPRE